MALAMVHAKVVGTVKRTCRSVGFVAMILSFLARGLAAQWSRQDRGAMGCSCSGDVGCSERCVRSQTGEKEGPSVARPPLAALCHPEQCSGVLLGRLPPQVHVQAR